MAGRGRISGSDRGILSVDVWLYPENSGKAGLLPFLLLRALSAAGYQYAAFTNLPLIAEGRLSIAVNMALLGFIFSAYRYDRVGMETSSRLSF